MTVSAMMRQRNVLNLQFVKIPNLDVLGEILHFTGLIKHITAKRHFAVWKMPLNTAQMTRDYCSNTSSCLKIQMQVSKKDWAFMTSTPNS